VDGLAVGCLWEEVAMVCGLSTEGGSEFFHDARPRPCEEGRLPPGQRFNVP